MLASNAKLKEELFLFLSSRKKAELQEDKEVQVVADSVAKQNELLHKKNLALTKELLDSREKHSRDIQKVQLQLSEAESIAQELVNKEMFSELQTLRKSSQTEMERLSG